MKETLDQRTSRIVSACALLDREDRVKLLDSECAGDPELRESIERLFLEDIGAPQTDALKDEYSKALPAHYRLGNMIGSGGMADVFAAEDTRLKRRVAIKFLGSEFSKNAERLKRFLQEARSVSALNHPNILVIHDVGEKDGIRFIVTEYVEGETLSSRISRGGLRLGEAVNIAIGIASALTASHRAGIVHRDVKPDNVMIRDDGTVKVLDFGLAKETGGGLRSASGSEAETIAGMLTSPGLILGTPLYMSPEQARGRQLDGRTDIFSLGIVIYEMVTGKTPFGGNNPADIIASIIAGTPEDITHFVPDAPEFLVRIIEKSLRKDADERYGSMEHLLSDLKDLRNELTQVRRGEYDTGATAARTTALNTQSLILPRLLDWRIFAALAALIAIAAAGWSYVGLWPLNNRTFRESMKTVAVTSWNSGAGELVSAASFSPDGKLVAFAAATSGATELWVKPTVGGRSIQITRGGFYNQYPVWSPDGQEIAFFSSRGEDYGIWKVSFTGGQQILVAGGVGPTAAPRLWSRSGKVYFQESSELYAVNVASGERSRVTDFESKGLRPRAIAISKDESRIGFSIREADLWKIKTKAVDSENIEELASSVDQIDYLAWMPDAKSVVFSRSVEGTYQIFKAGDGFREPLQLSNGNTDFSVRDISDDGRRILFGSLNETSDLWMVDVASLKETVVADDVASEYWADVSLDGKSVVYQSVNQPERPFGGSICVKLIGADGKPSVVAQSGFSPVWSNDGSWIAYFRRSENGVSVWRLRPTGDDLLKLADGSVQTPGYTATPYLRTGENHLSWSPDGASLAYTVRNNGLSNIRIVGTDGSTDRQVTENKDPGETYCCPVWAPDGSTLVFPSEFSGVGTKGSRLWRAEIDGGQKKIFESTERIRLLGLRGGSRDVVFAQNSDSSGSSSVSGAVDVYVLSLETGRTSKVNTLANAYLQNVRLSPDGKSVAFVSRTEDLTILWLSPVNGGPTRKLLVEKDPKTLISELAWSSDSKTIVFGRQTRTTLLSMLAE